LVTILVFDVRARMPLEFWSNLYGTELLNGNKKPAIRADNGPQFTSHIFENICSNLA